MGGNAGQQPLATQIKERISPPGTSLPVGRAASERAPCACCSLSTGIIVPQITYPDPTIMEREEGCLHIRLSRPTTESRRSIDSRALARAGVLRPGARTVMRWMKGAEQTAAIAIRAQDGAVELAYRCRAHNRRLEHQQYSVCVESTACRFGGERFWFRCPEAQCGRRVAILYQSDQRFVCRLCAGLVYATTREGACDRALRRVARVRKLLGWESNLQLNSGSKPKRMRWTTFTRLLLENDAQTLTAWHTVAAHIGLNTPLLPKLLPPRLHAERGA